MGLFDVLVLAAAATLLLYGAARGMARVALTFAGLCLGWLAGVHFAEDLALRLGAARSPSPGTPDLLRLAAFVFLLVSIAFAASILGWLITRALTWARLGWMDRMAGAALGLLCAILLSCAATVPLAALWPPDGGWLLRRSTLAPFAVAGGGYLRRAVPEPLRSRFTEASRTLLAGAPAGSSVPSGPTPGPAPRPR